MSSAEAFKNAFQAVQQSDNFAKPSVPQSGAANAAASGRSHVVSTAERRRQSSNISRQERIAAELERERMTSKSFEDSRALFVHARQRRNTALLSHITNVPIKFTTHFVPDFYLGNNACALYLSVKYHRLHPNYIKNRVCALRSNYRLRVIMVVVDVQDFVKSLQDITRFALANDCTVIVATSNREAARYLETYKLYENKKAEEIAAKKAPPGDFLQQARMDGIHAPSGRLDVLGFEHAHPISVLGFEHAHPNPGREQDGCPEPPYRVWVRARDHEGSRDLRFTLSFTMLPNQRALTGCCIAQAPAHELSLCPGIGPKKVCSVCAASLSV